MPYWEARTRTAQAASPGQGVSAITMPTAWSMTDRLPSARRNCSFSARSRPTSLSASSSGPAGRGTIVSTS
ncbi:hypothetical protein [Actinacidiphila glaucinigra]|uniref:hypothetical protein n=1 Tax=Actinacidiphila glaucinigra TaxID=235986 RepID=UPI001FE52424|nr:hypothetical protein [Actinacidiphila glaucinigra]